MGLKRSGLLLLIWFKVVSHNIIFQIGHLSMNGKKVKELRQVVKQMFKEVVDPLELKRIMRQAKKQYIACKGVTKKDYEQRVACRD